MMALRSVSDSTGASFLKLVMCTVSARPSSTQVLLQVHTASSPRTCTHPCIHACMHLRAQHVAAKGKWPDSCTLCCFTLCCFAEQRAA